LTIEEIDRRYRLLGIGFSLGLEADGISTGSSPLVNSARPLFLYARFVSVTINRPVDPLTVSRDRICIRGSPLVAMRSRRLTARNRSAARRLEKFLKDSARSSRVL
jgi:hypothetical protein